MNWSVNHAPRTPAPAAPVSLESIRAALVRQLESRSLIILSPEQAKLLIDHLEPK